MRTAAILLFAVSIGTARADTTLCTFSSANHDIEFAGDAAVARIYVQTTEGPRALPARSYRIVRFDARAARVELVFDNPGDATLPPSFTLKASGRDAWITQGRERERGELHCGP